MLIGSEKRAESSTSLSLDPAWVREELPLGNLFLGRSVGEHC